MGGHKVRHNKTCQNCGSFVEHTYCPKCGQENSDSRHSFHHLFTHFIFDFIHYDSSFWKTIINLFRYPGKLSLEYMNGKRKTYVNPFTLYIFISFITFLVPSMLPHNKSDNESTFNEKLDEKLSEKPSKKIGITAEYHPESGDSSKVTDENTVELASRLDSSYKALPKTKQIISSDGTLYKTVLSVFQNAKNKEKSEKAYEFFIHNLPKVLFIYMPLFAFWLWLFNNKKKKYYFDSGILTLHFFSVILLSITICNILSCLFGWIGINNLKALLWTIFAIYITFYFFRGNRLFFGQKRWVANIKSSILIFINGFLIIMITTLYSAFVIYQIYKPH